MTVISLGPAPTRCSDIQLAEPGATWNGSLQAPVSTTTAAAIRSRRCFITGSSLKAVR